MSSGWCPQERLSTQEGLVAGEEKVLSNYHRITEGIAEGKGSSGFLPPQAAVCKQLSKTTTQGQENIPSVESTGWISASSSF